MSQQTFKPGDVVKSVSPPSEAELTVLGERPGYPGMVFCRQAVGGAEIPYFPSNLALVRRAGDKDAS